MKFRRQHAIGSFVVDFCSIKKKLVIELDGETHVGEAPVAHDAKRDAFLRQQDFHVLRFSNEIVVIDIASVVDTVLSEVMS